MVADFKKNIKHNPLGKFLFHFGGVLVIGLVVFLVVANARIYRKKQEFLAQVSDLKNQVTDIQKRNSELQQGIAKSDDPGYIEKVAREELDLQKPGEQAVSFILPQTEAQKPGPAKQNPVQGWLSGVWNWIKSKI